MDEWNIYSLFLFRCQEASTRSKLENDCASLQSTVEELNVQIDKVTSARDKTLKKMENVSITTSHVDVTELV